MLGKLLRLLLLLLRLLLHCILRLVAGILKCYTHVAAAPDGVVLLSRYHVRSLGGVDALLSGVCCLPPRCLFACEIVAESTVVRRTAAHWLGAAVVLMVTTSAAG